MRKGWALTISIIFAVLLAVHILLSFIMEVGLDADLYKDAQIAENVAESAEVSQETLDVATKGLIDYMDDERDDLVIIDSEKEDYELFNTKEKSHMVDVKNLFTLGKFVNRAIFIVLLLILIFFLVHDKDSMRRYFPKFTAISLLVVLGVWLIIAVIALIDFTAFWTAFHKVFFRNDLWLLNPNTDFLIRMMPQQFFVRVVTAIMTKFLVSYGLVLAVLGTCHKLMNRRNGKVVREKTYE